MLTGPEKGTSGLSPGPHLGQTHQNPGEHERALAENKPSSPSPRHAGPPDPTREGAAGTHRARVLPAVQRRLASACRNLACVVSQQFSCLKRTRSIASR